MKTSLFDYTLPESLIAKIPLKNRAQSRLLTFNRKTQTKTHLLFSDLSDQLTDQDVLITNNSKVLKARLFGKTETGKDIECLLIAQQTPHHWTALAKPRKKLKDGDILHFGIDFKARVVKKEPPFIDLFFEESVNILEKLDQFGHVPLPPYIQSKDKNAPEFEDNYQTVFAKEAGSVAAPTAGLHFTPEILKALSQKKIPVETITLHVGYGTFKPIDTERITDHIMHFETYTIDPETAQRLTHYKNDGKRLIAVGTTSIRTLESAYKNKAFESGTHQTNLYITPGYEFKAINGLITNFHLPKSTLLVLIASFMGMDALSDLYQDAIKQQYRFYSFGDAMMVT